MDPLKLMEWSEFRLAIRAWIADHPEAVEEVLQEAMCPPRDSPITAEAQWAALWARAGLEPPAPY
jgi:hypothetical protein